MTKKWDILEEVKEVLTEMGGPGSGNWGHRGRKGKRGGSVPSRAGGIAAAVAKRAAREAAGGAPKPTPYGKKGEEYTAARVDREVSKVVGNALIASAFTPADAKYLEYRATKKAVTIKDKGGYFGHVSARLTQGELDRKKLTVGQVTNFLDKHGASKYKAPRRKRKRPRHYVHYD